METIDRKAKTLQHWEEILFPREAEALHDFGHTDLEEVLEPSAVLDIIVAWMGGIASGYQLRSLVSRVYGVEL